jgi:hypothetical protein
MDVAAHPSYPREQGTPVSQVPFRDQGPRPFYPAMCIQTHWDPTAILRRTLPTQYVPQTLDPRPWAKICLRYTTTGEDLGAPEVPASTVLAGAGQFYPTSRYMEGIDAESQLRRLDRPLGTCEKDQYEPSMQGDMFNQRLLVPTATTDTRLVDEATNPKVLITAAPYVCRHQNDLKNIALSDRMFNNATKQDRYKLLGKV